MHQMVWNATKHEFRVQQGGSGVFIAKNSDATSWHKLLHLFDPFCSEFRKQPNDPKCTQMVWNVTKLEFRSIGCVRCEKFWRDFVARTFALVRNVSPRVLQGYQMLANAPKRYETHQNMSLGSHGVDRVLLLWKIPMRLRGTNFCISLARFAPSFVRQPSGPKCTQTVWNATKH